MAAKVTVRGHSVVPGKPDEAEFILTLSVLDARAEQALAEVARQTEALGQILDELEIPSGSRVSSGVTVEEEEEWEDEELIHRGHRATSRVKVRLRDLGSIGLLIGQATSRAGAQVRGPRWRLDLGNPARLDACRLAAEEARRKAEAYAQALGLRLGAVIEVTEPGMSTRREPAFEGMAIAAAALPNLHVDAGELDVSAAVEVTFALDH